MVKRLTIFVVVLGLIGAFGVTVMSQQEGSPVKTFVYAAKFTCGHQVRTDDDVVQGIYRTNINVHNPNAGTVNFAIKVVLPDNATSPFPSGVTPLIPESLDSDHSLFIDCFTGESQSIASQMTAAGFTVPDQDTKEFEGFVVIESQVVGNQQNANLDVVGKYTARPGSIPSGPATTTAGNVSSLQVVAVSPDTVSLPQLIFRR